MNGISPSGFSTISIAFGTAQPQGERRRELWNGTETYTGGWCDCLTLEVRQLLDTREPLEQSLIGDTPITVLPLLADKLLMTYDKQWKFTALVPNVHVRRTIF
jgi:hypothetical protein